MRFRTELLARLTMQEIRRRYNNTILLSALASVLRPACGRLVSKVCLDLVFVVHLLTKSVPCGLRQFAGLCILSCLIGCKAPDPVAVLRSIVTGKKIITPKVTTGGLRGGGLRSRNLGWSPGG